MKTKNITLSDWAVLKSRTCDKGHHKLRQNHYGVTWCIICGKLSSTNDVNELEDGESFTIITD